MTAFIYETATIRLHHSMGHYSSGAGVALLFQPRAHSDHSRTARLHFDLRPTDRRAAVNRAIELGATLPPWAAAITAWTVLADPEGNEFCMLQSDSDYEQFVASEPATVPPDPIST